MSVSAVRGALYLTDRNGGKPFRDSDEVILQLLARHATHIITTLCTSACAC